MRSARRLPYAPLAACALAIAAFACAAGCAGANRPAQRIGGADQAYPPAARAAGIEGVVVVRYDVAADGTVSNARVESAAPAGVFDAAALAAVRSWIFRPMLVRGVPTPARAMRSELRFRIGDAPRYRLPVPP